METFKHTGKTRKELVTKKPKEIDLNIIGRQVFTLKEKGFFIDEIVVNLPTADTLAELLIGRELHPFELPNWENLTAWGHPVKVRPLLKGFQIKCSKKLHWFWAHDFANEPPTHPMCRMHPLTGTVKDVNIHAIKQMLGKL